MRHLTITIMTFQELTEGFDYLTIEDGRLLNEMQSSFTFDLEEEAPLEPRKFSLEAYAEALTDLDPKSGDEYAETCSRPNPKRKVRRNQA